MKKRIARTFLLLSLVTSLTGCSTVGRTIGGVMKIPDAVLKLATRTVNGIGGTGGTGG